MGYFNFPHTRNYDSDLGFLIHRYKEISAENKTLSETVSELKKMVETYFSDLNVQTEINNKIDAMVQSGELAEILNVQLLDNINDRVNIIEYNINNIEGDILNVYDEIGDITSNNKFYRNTFRFYLDGVNGDDNNDGRTRETPFKTIEKVLDYLTESADTRCYIIAPGIYRINKPVLTSCAIHITAEVENVELRWTAANPCIYSSHINMACNVPGVPRAEMRITAEQEAPYFEGCTTTVTNVNFDIPNLLTYGGSFYSNGITCKCATFNSTKVRFITYTNIMNTDTTVNALYIDRGSDFSIRDTLSIQPLGDEGTGCIIYCRQSNIRVYSTPSVQTNYKNGIGLTYGIAIMRENVKNAYADSSRNGNNFETPSLVISTAGTI